MTVIDKHPEAIVRGGADQITVSVSDDHQAMALRFDFQRPIEGRWQTIPTEVILDTRVGMSLMLTLQEIQRTLGIPIPEGWLSTVQREEGD